MLNNTSTVYYYTQVPAKHIIYRLNFMENFLTTNNSIFGIQQLNFIIMKNIKKT
jgi:hypothetical protein